MKKTLTCCAFIMLSVSTLLAQKQNKTVTYLYDASTQPPEMFVDVQHLKLELSKIDPVKKYMEGKATYTIKTLRENTDSIVFNAKDLTMKSVTVNGVTAKTKMSGESIIVYPPQKLEWQKEFTVFFDYTATPSNFHFIGWDDKTNTKRKTMWALSLSTYAPYIPVKHDLLTSETITTFDKNYQVLSNGVKVSYKENADGTATWHYSLTKPHNYGLITHFIGQYDIKKFKTKRGLPLEYWYFKDRKNDVETGYKFSAEMFDFLEDEFGLEYPWALYQQAPVMDCPFGGMECTTATIFNENLFADSRGFLDRNYVNVNSHELVHQWFGDYVSYTNSENIWTSESFATYYAKKYEQWHYGDEHYQNMRLKEYQRTIDASLKDDYPIAHEKGSVPRWYPKGSLMIDMLRYVMGEKNFKLFIKHLLHTNPYDIVEGNDYKEAAREATGMTLDWFFEQWIYRGGEPHYKVSYKQADEISGQRNTLVAVQQIQEITELNGYFKMPIVVEVHYKDGTKDSVTSWVEKEYTEIAIPNPSKKQISFVLFDPNRNVLKKISFDRSFEELSAQFTSAKNMIDRYDALLELKKTDVEKKRDLLLAQYAQEKFFLNKSEIIAQLADDKNEKTLQLFTKAINDKDVEVRRAVVTNVKNIDSKIQKEYEKLLRDSSYAIVTASLQNLSDNFPKEVDNYLNVTKNEVGLYGKNIRIKWLEIAVDNNKGNQYLSELIDYTNIVKYEYMTCSNAIQSLKRMNYLDDIFASFLVNNYFYWNDKVSSDAKDAISYFTQQNKFRKILKAQMMTRSEDEQKRLREIIN